LASGNQAANRSTGDVLETGKEILGLQACNNAIGEENPQNVEVASGLYRKKKKKNIEVAVGLYRKK
jgi:ribosomal protein L30E